MDPRPKQRRRHDGWTPERQARFLAMLERSGCVTTAAAAAGKSRAGAYRFRDRGDGRFGLLWELALRRRNERLLAERVAKLTLAALPGPADRPLRSALPAREGDEGDSLPRTAAAPSKASTLSPFAGLCR